MSGGVAVVQYDNDYLINGTQKGPTGTTIIQSGKDFLSCGAIAGLAVKNITTGTLGHIISSTEFYVVTDITFSHNDSYEIYHTGDYNSVISTIFTDRRVGLKTVNTNELENGLFPDDRDVDENGSRVFGPGEPWETRI